MTETQTPPSSSSPRRRRWPRRVLLGLIAAVAIFVIWLSLRGGRTVDRPLVALLPENTAIALQVHRLADLFTLYDTSPLSDLIANDVQIGALLLSSEDLRDLQRAHTEAELTTRLDLGRDFILGWAGQELTIAYIPAPGEPHPGLVVMTQADLGFKERLIELVAQLYPGADLVTTEHLGTSITTFVGDRPRDSLSFCRFGETVALSLRTDSTAYLRAIVDAVRSENPPDQPAFPPPTVPGIHAWANFDRLPAFLASLPSDGVQMWLASPEGESTLAMAEPYEEAWLTYTLDAPMRIDLTLHARPGALDPVGDTQDWQETVSRDTLATLHLQDPTQWWNQFGGFLFDFSIDDDPDWSPERRERHRAKRQWRLVLIDWLEREILPLLDGPATIALHGITPGFGSINVRAVLTWETSQPEALERAIGSVSFDFPGTLLADIPPEHCPDWLVRPAGERVVEGERFETWVTPIGQLGWTVADDRLLMTLDGPHSSLTQGMLTGWGSTLDDQRAYVAMDRRLGPEPRPAELYIHALRLTELTPLLLLDPDLWTESGQRNLRRIQMANHLMRQYPAVALAVRQGEETLALTLAVVSSDELAPQAAITAPAE